MSSLPTANTIVRPVSPSTRNSEWRVSHHSQSCLKEQGRLSSIKVPEKPTPHIEVVGFSSWTASCADGKVRRLGFLE